MNHDAIQYGIILILMVRVWYQDWKLDKFMDASSKAIHTSIEALATLNTLVNFITNRAKQAVQP